MAPWSWLRTMMSMSSSADRQMPEDIPESTSVCARCCVNQHLIVVIVVILYLQVGGSEKEHLILTNQTPYYLDYVCPTSSEMKKIGSASFSLPFTHPNSAGFSSSYSLFLGLR